MEAKRQGFNDYGMRPIRVHHTPADLLQDRNGNELPQELKAAILEAYGVPVPAGRCCRRSQFKGVTIPIIARQLGVSAATITKVLNKRYGRANP